jgi:hypothetical protein
MTMRWGFESETSTRLRVESVISRAEAVVARAEAVIAAAEARIAAAERAAGVAADPPKP